MRVSRRLTIAAAVFGAVVAGIWWILGGQDVPKTNRLTSSGGVTNTAFGIADFALLDHRGQYHRMKYHTDATLIVFVSHQRACADAVNAAAQLDDLGARFADVALRRFLVNANPGAERSAVAADAVARGIELPILMDPSQLAVRVLGLTRNGSAAIVDPETWTVVYRGPVSTSDTALATVVQALVEGRAVPSQPVSTDTGCPIAPLPPIEASYRNDIAPLLQRKCTQCHVTDGVAPWAMTSYDMVRAWAPRIRDMVMTRRMPPWGADPAYGTFANDRGLSEAERRALIHWIDASTPRGEGPDPIAVAARAASSEGDTPWPLGEPDLLIELPIQLIPAEGILPWRRGFVPISNDRDVWVRAIDVRPSNPSIVHHAATLLEYPEDRRDQQPEYHDGLAGFFTMYLPGDEPRLFPAGTGVLIPAGARLEYQLHYTPRGERATDRMQVGVYLLDEPPPREFKMASAYSTEFEIPPMVRDYELRAEHRFEETVEIRGLYPHMHYRGQAIRYDAILPNGRRETLLSVPFYDFNWQTYYELAKPLVVPAGTRVIATGIFDNSPLNLLNPDPTQVCRHGEAEADEMFVNWITYTTVGGSTRSGRPPTISSEDGADGSGS